MVLEEQARDHVRSRAENGLVDRRRRRQRGDVTVIMWTFRSS